MVATPDIEAFSLEEGDEFLILACDGIWDVLTNQEVGGRAGGRLYGVEPGTEEWLMGLGSPRPRSAAHSVSPVDAHADPLAEGQQHTLVRVCACRPWTLCASA